MRTDAVDLYFKAIRHASIEGFAQIAHDFASWYIIKVIEGTRKKQLIRFAFIDYLRETRGNDGAYRNNRYIERTCVTRIEDFDDHVADKDKKNDALSSLIMNETVQKKLARMKPKDREIIELYFIDEKPMDEIARVKGVGSSRISQRIKKILKESSGSGD